MIKQAEPLLGSCNVTRRARGFTLQEWRDLSDDLFERAATDIFKNIQSVMKEDVDIRQHLEAFFVMSYNRFMEGDNKYEFPPTPGAFYLRCFYQAAKLFSFVRLNRITYVNSTPHNSMICHYDQRLIDFHEERENRIEAQKDYDLYRQLESVLDISGDGPLGAEFDFWWLGYTYSTISTMLNAVDGGKGHSVATVQRRLTIAFREIEEKHGISKADMRKLRKGSIFVKSMQGHD